jgi:oxygen-dependent protoporphyrinogen oxidase
VASVLIIGGGISGLSAAYFLEEQARERGLSLDITLIEKSSRLGGVIQSERVDLPHSGQSFLCEAGPDSLLTTKPAAIDLCRKLGLGEQLIPSNDALRKTYVLHHGRLRSLPDGLMFVVPTKIRPMFSSGLLSPAGKLRLLLSPLLSPGPLPDGEDASVENYIARRFGREVSDRLAEPLLNAVYGSDVRQMSTRAVFPQLLAMEKKHGSLWKAFAGQIARGGGAPHATQHSPAAGQAARPASTVFVTLRDGLGQLPAKVAGALRTTRVVHGESVRQVLRDTERGGWRVASDQAERRCDALVIAAPAPVAAGILQAGAAAVSECLGSIVYHSVAIAALGYATTPSAPQAGDWGRRGFGFVVPRGEGRQTIACTWVHNKFSHRAPSGAALVRSFFGGARDGAIDQRSSDDVLAAARGELADIMGLQAAPDFHRVFRWARCMPQYSVGHLDLLARLEARLAQLPGLALAGNGFRGVGIPDCVQSAAQAAQSVVAALRP